MNAASGPFLVFSIEKAMTQNLDAVLRSIETAVINPECKGAIVEDDGLTECVLVLTRDAALAMAQALIEDVIEFDQQGGAIASDRFSRYLLQLPGLNSPWICSSEIVPDNEALKKRLLEFHQADSDVMDAIQCDPTMPWNQGV